VEFLPLGGAREVGGSCSLLTLAGVRLLIDAGIRPALAALPSRLPDWTPLAAHPPLRS
jgi:Cft2 family RNA processing exonuclease